MAETILFFASDEAQARSKLPGTLESMGPASSLWVAYPKANKELHRDTLRKLGESLGLTGVSLVAVDDVWSAMRFKRS
jgi:hypothetical protein